LEFCKGVISKKVNERSGAGHPLIKCQML